MACVDRAGRWLALPPCTFCTCIHTQSRHHDAESAAVQRPTLGAQSQRPWSRCQVCTCSMPHVCVVPGRRYCELARALTYPGQLALFLEQPVWCQHPDTIQSRRAVQCSTSWQQGSCGSCTASDRQYAPNYKAGTRPLEQTLHRPHAAAEMLVVCALQPTSTTPSGRPRKMPAALRGWTSSAS